MLYLTYTETGDVDGAYMQDLHPSHANCSIEVTPEQYANWLSFRVVNGALVSKPAEPIPTPSPAEVLKRETIDMQLWAMRKAILTGDTADLQQIDANIEALKEADMLPPMFDQAKTKDSK